WFREIAVWVGGGRLAWRSAAEDNHMMEWQGVITGEGDRSVGTLLTLADKLKELFPGLSFEWSLPGADQLAAADARGVKLPDFVRRVISAKPSNYCGTIECGPLPVSFNLGNADPVTCIWA